MNWFRSLLHKETVLELKSSYNDFRDLWSLSFKSQYMTKTMIQKLTPHEWYINIIEHGFLIFVYVQR